MRDVLISLQHGPPAVPTWWQRPWPNTITFWFFSLYFLFSILRFLSFLCRTSSCRLQVCSYVRLSSFAFFILRKFSIPLSNNFLFAGKSQVMIDAWIKVNLKRMGWNRGRWRFSFFKSELPAAVLVLMAMKTFSDTIQWCMDRNKKVYN